jgi:DivIVA domain-containing protein
MGDAVTSQGQRFRRRALRRGYKVDEVDSFLDRVEATLAGEQIGAPVGAQEVHDVVFRVRFGGYDEWQVDLHLDRVERQLAELEERGGRPHDPRMSPDRGGSGMPDRMGVDRGMPDRGMPDRGMPDRGMPDRMAPPMNRTAPPTERLPAPVRGDEYGRDDPYGRDDRPMAPPPPMGPRPITPMPAPSGPDPYGRYEDPGYGQPQAPPPASYDPGDRYDGFEPGRHGKSDMTAEMRMADRDTRGGSGFGAPTPMSAPPMSTSPMSGPPFGGGQGGGQGGGDLHRVDQLRRTFQPRRFGSGYDPMQVDRLFEGLLAAMSGRGPMPVNENELETLQFGLVPGGYFEAEVDAALREVRDILRRH